MQTEAPRENKWKWTEQSKKHGLQSHNLMYISVPVRREAVKEADNIW